MDGHARQRRQIFIGYLFDVNVGTIPALNINWGLSIAWPG